MVFPVIVIVIEIVIVVETSCIYSYLTLFCTPRNYSPQLGSSPSRHFELELGKQAGIAKANKPKRH